MLDGAVGAMVGGFQSAGRLMSVVGAVMEAAVGEGPQSRLWKNKKRSATWTPFGVSR